ncbi:serine hydrolase domain-containing protein [Reichenbachiella sp.]
MKKLGSFLLAVVCLLLSNCNPKNKTEGLTAEISSTLEQFGWSKQKSQSIDSLIEKHIALGHIPGGAAFISKNGQTIHYKGYGKRDVEGNVNQQKDDLFRIASMTKAITAAAALMLYEEGRFSFEDSLATYLPEFAQPVILENIDSASATFMSYPAKKPILIKHIFTHTSGIPYAFQDDRLQSLFDKYEITEGFEERDITLKQNCERLAKLPLMHKPGKQFTYGMSSDILGRLIEVWSGQPLDQFFQSRIFEPLEMNDTYFYLPEEKFERLSTVYMSTDSGIAVTDYPLTNYPIKGAKIYFSGGADLSCTALDYAKFAQMVMNGGEYNGKRLLKQETIAMITNHTDSLDHMKLGQGFGVVYDSWHGNNRPSIGSHQWGGFFSTSCLADQEENLIMILLLQMYPYDQDHLHGKFQKLVYNLTSNE